jgi:hypothetical protein
MPNKRNSRCGLAYHVVRQGLQHKISIFYTIIKINLLYYMSKRLKLNIKGLYRLKYVVWVKSIKYYFVYFS